MTSEGRRHFRSSPHGSMALGICALAGVAAGCDSGSRVSSRGSSPAQAAVAVPVSSSDGAHVREPRSLEPCVPAVAEVCFNALDDNCNGVIDEGCGIPGGVVQFMIAWDAPRADVDLNVTDPNGELIEAGRSSQGGLVKSKDCPGRRQECGGVNFENVFLEGSKAPTLGTYRIAISLESLAGDEPPIWVNLSSRLGAKHAAFEVELDEPTDEALLELSL